MKTHALIGTLSAALIAMATPAFGSAYTGGGALNDWNDPANWGAGDFTGGAGVLPTQAGNIGAAFGDIDFTFTQAGASSAYMIVGSSLGNTLTIAGGDLTYTGDGLLGTTASVSTGAADIDQTAGTVTQTGGGAGFLIGHNAGADYSISGGSVIVKSTSPTLTINYTGGGGADVASALNISGTGLVDVESDLVINANGTLNVTGNGLLIWRNHVVADVSGANFAGTVNATITQVGNDVHFTVVPEPGSLALLGLGGLCVLRRRRK